MIFMMIEKEGGVLRGVPFSRKTTIIWAVSVAALLVAGAPFLFDRLMNGLAITGTTNRVPWGLWVVAYTWFSGLAGGLFLVSSLGYLFRLKCFMPVARLALAGSVAFLAVSMLLIGLDLGVLGNAAGALLYFHWSSALSWEIKLYVVFAVIVLVQLALVLRNDFVDMERRGNRNLAVRVLSGLGVALSFVGPPGGTGMFFSVVKARGLWNDGIMAVLFYVMAIATAAAFLMVAYVLLARLRQRRFEQATTRGLSIVLASSLAAMAFVLYFQIATPLMGGVAQSFQAASALTAGSLAPLFWIGGVVIGVALPGALLAGASCRGRVVLAVVAGVAAMVGVFALRYVLIMAGFDVPLLQGMPGSVYVPSIAEIMVLVFAFGCAGGLFGLAVRFLPLEVASASEGMLEPAYAYAGAGTEEVRRGTAA